MGMGLISQGYRSFTPYEWKKLIEEVGDCQGETPPGAV